MLRSSIGTHTQIGVSGQVIFIPLRLSSSSSFLVISSLFSSGLPSTSVVNTALLVIGGVRYCEILQLFNRKDMVLVCTMSWICTFPGTAPYWTDQCDHPFWDIYDVFLGDTSPTLSGVGLSLAVITKVSPILFLGYILTNKSYKVIAVAILTTLCLSLLSVLRYGLFPLLTYPNVFEGLLRQFLLTSNSQTLAAKLAIANYPQFQRFLARLPEV